jgi:hypothetical protein
MKRMALGLAGSHTKYKEEKGMGIYRQKDREGKPYGPYIVQASPTGPI